MASTSASCTEFTYGMPSRAAVKSCVSVAALPSSAGPTAAALELYTTRSTSARRHSSITILVPRTFTSNSSSASPGRTEVTPAQWNTRETPLSARRTERLSRTSSFTRLWSRPAIAESGEPSCDAQGEVVSALVEHAGHVGTDEAGGAGDQHAGQGRPSVGRV